MRACLALSLLTLLNGCHAREHPPTAARVIVITADDLGWLDLGVYGNDQLDTPHLDRLAEEGVRFTQAFVVSSSCSPSRASLITGQYPHTHGTDGLTTSHFDKALPPGYEPLLPGTLQQAGFRTAIEGKWHVAPFEDPSEYGYDERLNEPAAYHMDSPERAIGFLQRNMGGRFYLELNTMHNHRGEISGEFEAHPDFPVSSESVSVPEYWALPDWPEIREEVAMFWSQTMAMDALVGEVLDVLDALDMADDTLVVFLSDNGPPFPGNKMTLYDRGVGTPLIVRWPAGLDPGVVDAPVASIDVMPTILEAAGVEVPEGVEGRSFLSLLQDPSAPATRDAIFTEMTWHVEYVPARAVRADGWAYIRNYADTPWGLDQCEDMEWAQELAELPNQPWLEPRVPDELYDLEADPTQQVNLAEDPAFATVMEDLQQQLDEHLEATDDPYLGAPFEEIYEEGDTGR